MAFQLPKLILLFTLFIFFNCPSLIGQPCSESAEIFSFEYDGRTYHLVKENLKWIDAANCAASRGGKLVEINSEGEQQAVFEAVSNASIILNATYATDFEEIAFVWLGGNDIIYEGDWQWDGNNDGSGGLFWVGTTTGATVAGAYVNWGNDPDNADDQDGLGMALTQWPLGIAGEWADLKISNDLYYVIEYSTLLSNQNIVPQNNLVRLFPNPAGSYVTIENLSGIDISGIQIFHINGSEILNFSLDSSQRLDITRLAPGLYLVKSQLETGSVVINKLVVK